VLNRGGDDVAASAEDRHVVRFRAAAGEDDLFGLSPEHPCNRAPRLIENRASLLAEPVNARGVSKYGCHQGSHSLEHFRRNRSGRIVIEVVGWHGFHYNLISTWRTG